MSINRTIGTNVSAVLLSTLVKNSRRIFDGTREDVRLSLQSRVININLFELNQIKFNDL